MVAAIPHGRVATYGQVAAQAGNRRAARQVAWALRAYAGTGLPWHRVIGAGGAIRLPGDGLQRQRSLLLAEGVAVDPDGRLDLAVYRVAPMTGRGTGGAGLPVSGVPALPVPGAGASGSAVARRRARGRTAQKEAA